MKSLPLAAAAGAMSGLVALTISVPSQAEGWQPVTAKQLGERCRASDAAKHAACVGYVTGIYDLQFAQTPVRGVCAPANLNPENLSEVVLAYIDTHDDAPATAAIAQAIVRFFPCPPEGQKPEGPRPDVQKPEARSEPGRR